MATTPTVIDFPYLKDLVYPAIVALAASFFSYQATYKLNKQSQIEEKNIKIIDLAETLRLEIGKLNLILEKLKEDVEVFNYFSLKNIPIATASANRLKSLNEKVILFENDNLRREIIETTDSASSLIEDLYIMENYQVSEENRLKQVSSDAEKEFRQFKLNLLSLGIYMDGEKAKYIDNNQDKKTTEIMDRKLVTIEGIFNNLLSDIDTTSLVKLKADNEKKRTLLVTRILDIQSKLRALITNLKDY